MSTRDDVSFWGLTPRQIYEQLTGGPGSNRLADASDAAAREWQLEEDRANEIHALAADMRSGWEGQASDAAHGAAGPLAESALQGASQLHASEYMLIRQTEEFHSAAHNVVPVPEKPPESTILNDVIPWETDLDQEIQKYQADAQHNINVFRAYDTTSLDHETPLAREYSTVTHSGGDISVRSPGDSIGNGDYRDSGGGGPLNYSVPNGGDPGSSALGETARGGPRAGSDTTGDTGNDTGNDSTLSTRPAQVSPSVTPGPSLQNGGVPPVSQPGPTTTGSPSGGLTGTGPLTGAITGSDRSPGSGSGLGGRGGGAGGGPGARGGAPGAGTAERLVQRGGPAATPGARGAGGMGGMPMGAGGRGTGDEDKEHERKFMIEPDPEDTFGSDEVTAPQVIGDPRYEGA